MSSVPEPNPNPAASDAPAPAAVPESRRGESVARPETLARAGRAPAARVTAFARRYWADVLFWALSAALVVWVTLDAVWVRAITFAGGADYWEHTAALRALIERPFSPANPQVTSEVPSPRFGPHYVLTALLTKTFGGDAMDAMALVAVLNTVLFVAGIYLFFGTYFRDRRAPLYGLIVMFCSWWNAWNFSNVYQLKAYFLVAGYPSTASLALTLMGLWLAVRTLRGDAPLLRPAAALSLLWAYVFITHPLTAMLSLSGCVLLAATEPGVRRERRIWVGGTALAACVLAAAWPYFPTWEVVAGGKGEESGWLTRSMSGAAPSVPTQLHYFYYRTDRLVETLGLALAGIPIALFSLFTRRRFIGLGALSMTFPFVANIFVPLPLGHRFFLLAVFYLQLALVWLLVAVSPGRDALQGAPSARVRAWAGAALVAVTLGGIGWHNVEFALAGFREAKTRALYAESPFVRYARRVGELAGPNAIVLGDPVLAWPLPTFGPRVVALKHENPLVEDRVARNEAVELFLARGTSDDERRRILEHFQVTHVIVRAKQERQVGDFLSRHGKRHQLPSGHRLYALHVPAAR